MKTTIETGYQVECYNGTKGKIVGFNHCLYLMILDTGEKLHVQNIKYLNGREVEPGTEYILEDRYTNVEQIVTGHVEKCEHLPLGASVRIDNLDGLFSTYKRAFEFFGLMDKTRSSEGNFTKGWTYLDRIPKKYEVTEYIVKGYAFHHDRKNDNLKLLYWIQSVDGQSDLVMRANSIKEIEEYHSNNSY